MNVENEVKNVEIMLNKYKTAILVDGAFFIKRYRALSWSSVGFNPYDAGKAVKCLYKIIGLHLKHSKGELYRIFYYDCPPLNKKLQNPVSGYAVDLSQSKQAVFMDELFTELKKGRKVALRLGKLNDPGYWQIKQKKTKELLQGKIDINNLSPDDVEWSVNQKQVDMKMGLDVASLAYKRLVDQIIMIAGDSDFVPVAKVARREGIDFILDPMYKSISPELSEHIDGLYSTFGRKKETSDIGRAMMK